MTQEDAMNMNNKQAIQILTPFCDMLRDQNGCPISDAYFAMKKAIEALKETHWISVSERLPSAEHNFKGFLTTIKCYVENDVFIQVYVNGKFGHWDGEKLIPNDDVIAWMEMPSPYTEEDQ